jgi:serine protease
VQYVIASAPDTMPDTFPFKGWCAWHTWNGDPNIEGGPVSSPYGDIAFTNMPYVSQVDFLCGANLVNDGAAGVLDGVTVTAGMQYQETITDPYPSGGWKDDNRLETGDKCAYLTDGPGAAGNVTFSTGTFAVQSSWSNDVADCRLTHPVVWGKNVITVENPGYQTGVVGYSQNLQVRASASNPGTTLTYTASGLPSGLTLNPTTGLITGKPTAAKLWEVKVTVTDANGVSGSATFTWNIHATVCASLGEQLRNRDFETGTPAPWNASPGVVGKSDFEPSNAGVYRAKLGGYTSSRTDTLSQTITLPSNCFTYTFSYYLLIDSTAMFTEQDTMTVSVTTDTRTAILAKYTNLDTTNYKYVKKSFDLSAFAGKTVTIRFTGADNRSLPTWFLVDDTSVWLT